MLDKRIKFDESYIEEEYDTITLYFTAPKDLFDNIDIEAENVKISIECPREYILSGYASVEYSPTEYDEKEGYICYDWRDIDLPYDEIDELIELAEASGRM